MKSTVFLISINIFTHSGIGLLCCMLRIFFCICPSSCITSKRRKLKQKNAKVDIDHTTSLLCSDNKRVHISRSIEVLNLHYTFWFYGIWFSNIPICFIFFCSPNHPKRPKISWKKYHKVKWMREWKHYDNLPPPHYFCKVKKQIVQITYQRWKLIQVHYINSFHILFSCDLRIDDINVWLQFRFRKYNSCTSVTVSSDEWR